ncbi:hypothetical protein SAMD00019534_012300 [Acytostelium subglobosum LB1]|uniref:hypothetical protein n=1 Tax=Acytostelium subglobosum LB1 TaxID=1410327 RepID=UPI000644A0BA|nr:hypothetical protein SAMD00019534_012300 [Acytostelium subglobosum LB1]GAM18055.1 hypothetical protein SAMD00019534_012300 [Acytostelium subglobosum LB1]|eukprot:XP_012758651.1 hypothetical protein SAMD00019534_012300 [Acytostelium subglobosum LB1]
MSNTIGDDDHHGHGHGNGHGHAHGQDGQCSHMELSSTSQSLDELEFERGVWGAVVNNNVDKLRSLLNGNAALSNAVDRTGYYPLHYAARHNDTKCLGLLLDSGARVNVITDGGATPLHRAAFCGGINNCKLLLERDGRVLDQQDADGMTALHKAYSQNNLDVIEYLIQRGADTNIKDRRGKIPSEYKP